MSSVNATTEFLGHESGSPDTRITLDDVQGMWGGRRINISGGQVIVQIVDQTMTEQRFEFALEPNEWVELLDIFIRYDFLTIEPADRPGMPDEAHPTIMLTNAVGESHSIAKWAGVENDRFGDIYVTIVGIEAYTLGLDPVSTGPYGPGN